MYRKALLLLSACWFLADAGRVLGAASGLRPEELPPALRGVDLERLSSGAYAMLLAEAGKLKASPQQRAANTSGPIARPPPAVWSPKIGPNNPLGTEPEWLPSSRRAQAEPHLARSYVDPALLLATLQEGRFEDGGALNNGYAVSTDGGQSWRRGLIPHLVADLDGGPFRRASDPVAGLDARGYLYLNSLALLGSPPFFYGTIVVSKSTDRGQTFGPPLTVFSSAKVESFPDKNWLAVNSFPGTRTVNRLVVTYTFYTVTNLNGVDLSVYPITMTYSDDGGEQWSTPKIVSPLYCQGSQPLFLPDGSLAIVYWNFAGPRGSQIEVVHSPDGGETFEAPRLVTPVTFYSEPVARAVGYLPSATTDRQAGVMYVAYQALFGPLTDLKPRVLFTRSSDQGLTWTTPVPVNDTPEGRSVFNPAIAVSPDGQHVTIAFYDKRHDAGQGNLVDMYLAESFDAGETWEPNLRLSTVSSDLTLAPQTPMGRMVGDYHGLAPALDFETPGVALWVDTRSGAPDPYTARIQRSQGTTFETWRRLRFDATQLANPALSGDTADPDEDGIPNLMEYALSLSPAGKDPNPLREAGTGIGSPATLSVSYQRLAILGDLSFGWRASLNLADWRPVSPADEQMISGGAAFLRRVTASFPAAPDAHQFFGLGAQKRP
jgi:hypothetical protein